MRKILLLGAACLVGLSVHAQVELGSCSGAPEPSTEVLKAEQALDRNDLNMARVYLNAALRKSPEQSVHLNYLNAEMNLLMGKVDMASSLLNQVYLACPDYHPDLSYKLGALWAGQGRQEEARRLLESFVQQGPVGSPFLADARKQLATWALVDSLKKHPIAFEPYRIKGLDAPADEFLGVLSPDEASWYFTRRQEVLDRKSGPAPIRRLKEEFCIGQNSPAGVQGITVLSPPFNQGFNEGGPSLTADNRWMALTSCQLLGSGYRNCDIFLVQNTYDVWLDFKALETVNRPDSWESQPTLSANGDRLIFTSNRAGGLGGLDLYEVTRQVDGSWSEPRNLGPRVNTDGDEKSPFLHADGHSLFFSSNGHPGLGDFDVFVVDLSQASPPQNVGYPINTEKAEVGFAVAAKSPMAYFSSNEKVGDLPAGSGYDFYGFPLPESSRGDQVAFLTGIVEGADVLPDGVSLRIENLKTREVTRVRVDAATGTFTAVVSATEVSDYVVSIENPEVGFTAVRVEVDPRDEEAKVPILEAKKLEIGESFSLNSIRFATNSYQMSLLDKASLRPFIQYLKAHPAMRIELQGHTDNVGRASDNQLLSDRRAHAVMDYLATEGVDSSQMTAKGYGDSQPIADNSQASGRAMNRRTVFQVLSK
ncbi:OmpA family protein [Schleiferiaceae bacterium]|nr:OmpA family protein [Schleiferiaceae bacterium]